MAEQTFNIKKQGNYFVAFDTVDKKQSYGKINIISGKFIGDTRCIIQLNNVLSAYKIDNVSSKKQALIDKVIGQLEKDINDGDISAINELLILIPEKNLIAYLPE